MARRDWTVLWVLVEVLLLAMSGCRSGVRKGRL